MFICEICNKVFTRKYSLKYHLEKNKKKCSDKYSKIVNGNVSYICPHCSKIYTRKYYLDVHVQKNHSELLIQNDIHDIPENKKIQALENKIKELEDKILDTKNININITNNGNINSNNNNSNNINIDKINVNAFSHENDTYIPEKILDECVNNPFEGVVKLIKLVNFNDAHPENFNMYMNNKNKKRNIFFQ